MNRWMMFACVSLMAFSVALAGEGKDKDKDREGREGGRPGEAMFHQVLGKLNLTEEQKPKVKEILKAHHEEAEKFRQEHKEEFEALREKARQAREEGDREAMKKVHEDLKALMDKGPGGPLKALEKIKPVLTAEQNATLDKMMADMRERFEDGPPRRKDAPEGKEGGDRKKKNND
jgi:Spy/CpxP family protein refolding chaperone